MIKYDIRYESGCTRDVLNLVQGPYRLITGDLFNYSWEYDTASSGRRNGVNVTEFYREKTEKDMELDILARTESEYIAALDYFLTVTERDLLNKMPGKLYVGQWYLSCFLISSEKTEWEYGCTRLTNAIKLLSPYPFWCQEKTFDFFEQGTIVKGNREYNYRYPYWYAGNNGYQILNDHFYDSDFILTIFGPVSNPEIMIGGNLYKVNTPLLYGERLLIDSAKGTVKKIKNDGTIENAFHQRNLKESVFTKIPPGNRAVSWSGEFGFSITLLQERSEPPLSL